MAEAGASEVVTAFLVGDDEGDIEVLGVEGFRFVIEVLDL